MSKPPAEHELYEVFIRQHAGLGHRHVGSVRAPDAEMALQNARDSYTRRCEGVSIWVVPSRSIAASQPHEKEELFSPAEDKKYRRSDYYDVPDDVEYL